MKPAEIRGRIRRSQWLFIANSLMLVLNVGVAIFDWWFKVPRFGVVSAVAGVISLSGAIAVCKSIRRLRELLAKVEEFDQWFASLPEAIQQHVEHELKATREVERIHSL